MEREKKPQKFAAMKKIVTSKAIKRFPCIHKGTSANDCIVDRVTQHKCFIVATCDRDLKRRILKIPGVPMMYITQHKYSIEWLPEATIGGGYRRGHSPLLFSNSSQPNTRLKPESLKLFTVEPPV